jgi:alpha-beta hydrolase superfamily lysophospholipase
MKHDFEILNRPEICARIFHPRAEPIEKQVPGNQPGNADNKADSKKDHLIPVEKGIHVGARFHFGSEPACANLLFFHGNGEIVADYDDLAPFYNQSGINFFAVDYRGYGRSSGKPTIGNMLADCHVIFDYVRRWLKKNDWHGPLIVMGRSLGSASALELAACNPGQVQALVIESGFAFTRPLLRVLGINPDAIGLSSQNGLGHLDKIRRYQGPTLIIHAADDHIIPYTDAEALFHSSPASDKKLVRIEGANHNNILMHGFTEYMHAIQSLAAGL